MTEQQASIALPATTPQILMTHPETGAVVTTTRKALDTVWSKRGWEPAPDGATLSMGDGRGDDRTGGVQPGIETAGDSPDGHPDPASLEQPPS